MTDEQMGAMTLADLEAMAKRFGTAVATIREAQALLGGNGSATLVQPSPQRGPPPPHLSPAEMAERERLLKQFRHDGLPENIKQAEEAQ